MLSPSENNIAKIPVDGFIEPVRSVPVISISPTKYVKI
jgi:hypothetical protein